MPFPHSPVLKTMKPGGFSLLFSLAATCLAASTPAELAVQSARADIAQHSDFAPAYAHLAVAYARRARESGESVFLDDAQNAVPQSLELAPDNYDARKAQALVFLGRQEWTAALAIADKLNRQTPDDIM